MGQGIDRGPCFEHSSSSPRVLLCCLYQPWRDSRDAEMMSSEGKTIKLGLGLPSVPCSIATQAGARRPGFITSGSLLVAFLRTVHLGPEYPFQQSGFWLGSALSSHCSSPSRGWCLFGLQFRLIDLLSSLALICNLQVDGRLGCWQLDE